MKRFEWKRPISDDEAHARAKGRARYNAARQQAATKRRVRELLPLLGRRAPARGELGGLAKQLGVSRVTVCRDVAVLRRAGLIR